MSKSNQSVLLSALDNYGGHPFNQVFDLVYPTYGPNEVRLAHELSDKVALVIWGGQDISPSIYHQAPNAHTDAGSEPGRRDMLEIEMAKEAIDCGIPIIGICRGAQLMCALSGGSLVQHVQNHAGGYHMIDTDKGKTYSCPSLHHQMMHPWPRPDIEKLAEGPKFDLIAWSKGRSKQYLGEPVPEQDGLPKELEVPLEPEIVWFPKTKSLCIQSHPEFIDNLENPFLKYCLELTEQYVLQS